MFECFNSLIGPEWRIWCYSREFSSSIACKIIGSRSAKKSEWAHMDVKTFKCERAAPALGFKGWPFLGHTVYASQLQLNTQIINKNDICFSKSMYIPIVDQYCLEIVIIKDLMIVSSLYFPGISVRRYTQSIIND